MLRTQTLFTIGLIALGLTLALGSPRARAEDGKLNVVATTTNVRDLCREIGGEDVVVHGLTKGPEDPHFIQARPSYIKDAADADALVLTGMDLEIGYVPVLLRQSRNGKIQRGAAGYVDCSLNVPKLQVPTQAVDRSQGDVHPYGNPHYLLDPVRAKTAAATICDAFVKLDPSHTDAYRQRLMDFEHRLDVAMFGEDLVAVQKPSRLEARLAEGKLIEFLERRHLLDKLGGCAKELAPYAGRKVVVYHDNALYFLERFDLEQVGTLEPKPGIPPSPRHLAMLERQMRAQGAKVVLYNSYQPARTAESVAEKVGGRAVLLAHMPDSTDGTSSTIDMLKRNVRELVEAFKATESGNEED